MARKQPQHGTGTREIKWHGPVRVGEVVILENDDKGSTFAVTYTGERTTGLSPYAGRPFGERLVARLSCATGSPDPPAVGGTEGSSGSAPWRS
jgi:hypothetical protein